MKKQNYIERFVQQRLEDALADTPVILVHGPRQCGKTTLVKHFLGKKGYSYFSFDDEGILAAATEDPVGFVAGLPEFVILDEIQRAPGLFASIKLEVDRNRYPGRFILTGSTNILLLPKLSDSLAGRMEIIRLHPLSRCEVLGEDSSFIDMLFDGDVGAYRTDRLGDQIAELVTTGGYPEAHARTIAGRRKAWYRDYIETITQRDVRELTRIQGLNAIPNLLAMAAAQSAQLFNLSELAGPFNLSRPTISDYVTLLEGIFMVHRLRPWHTNLLNRLVKTPKLHLSDTGLACSLLDLTPDDLRADRQRLGHLLETFVVQELRRQASWSDRPPLFHHFRNRDGVEVDLVLERGPDKVSAVEVKLSATVTTKDFRGLKKIQLALGNRFKSGIVLYDGEELLPFGERLWAIPLGRVWDKG